MKKLLLKRGYVIKSSDAYKYQVPEKLASSAGELRFTEMGMF